MNNNEAQQLMAYHDAELTAEEIVEAEHLLARDSDARAFLKALKQADQLTVSHFDRELNEPVPERLLDTVREFPLPHDTAVQGKKVQEENPGEESAGEKIVELPVRQRSYRRFYAMAASVLVLLAVGISTQFNTGPADSYTALLNKTLESAPSGEVRKSEDEAWQIMPVATFDIASKGVCREFAGLHGDKQFFGLACRDSRGNWQNLMDNTFDAQLAQLDGETYVPVEGEEDQVASKLAELGEARSLTDEEERALLRQQWR